MFAEFDKNLEDFPEISPGQKIYLKELINLHKENLEFDWDVDQTLAISEDPVKSRVDADFGTSYLQRKIIGWETITKWLVADGILDVAAAKVYEQKLWVDSSILFEAKPNEHLRTFSYNAYLAGIPQNVTTVRVPGLRMSTYRWLNLYFPWIPSGKINFRVGNGITGHEFKLMTVNDMYEKNPNIVHVDDDFRIVRTLAAQKPDLGLIGIKYPNEDVSDIPHADHRVYLERDVLNSLIPVKDLKSPPLVAQSS